MIQRLTLAGMVVMSASTPAWATDTAIAAGDTFALPADLLLANADTFVAGDLAGTRCTIHGNGHALLTADDSWKGQVIIRNCDVDGLGSADAEAFNLRVSGSGKFIIENVRFSTSSRVVLNVSEHVDVIYRGNTIETDSVVPAVKLLLDSPPTFWSTGETDGMRLFQGNHVYKGRIKFTSTSGWLVGGPTTAESNVLAGVRTGLELENASLMIVQGNYSHTYAAGEQWNQVKNLSVNGGDGNIIEHNVWWARNWLVELNGGGELRYNLLVDAAERGWVLTRADAGAKIHHNLSLATRESPDSPTGGIVLEDSKTAGAPPTTEAFNNTFDLGGKCDPGVGAAVMLKDTAVLLSLRSNAFTGIRVPAAKGAALVGASDPTLPLVHLGYADYNLFYTPDSPVKVAYGVTVDGKTARVDAGFGLDDVPAGGTPDQQVDPAFTGPIPRTFPFNEDDVKAGAATPCQILAYYRGVYTPADGSPLIDAGDPQDGAGNDVGAVGAGAADPADLFGKLCDETDVGQPAATADVFTCKTVPLGAVTVVGPVERPHGITCVCDAGAAAPSPGASALGLGLAIVGLARHRRKAPARR